MAVKGMHGNGTRVEYTVLFEQFLKNTSDFHEALQIAQRNSRGGVWIIGGFVYRPIIDALYGPTKKPKEVDMDLLIEMVPERRNLYVPTGWDMQYTNYGNVSLSKDNLRIDLNHLFHFHSITARGLQPRLKHFFTGTPLNIQSIAYNLSNRQLGVTGKLGIDAIKRKIVKINNSDEAKYDTKLKGISLDELVKKKAEELGFTPVLG